MLNKSAAIIKQPQCYEKRAKIKNKRFLILKIEEKMLYSQIKSAKYVQARPHF